MKLHTLFEHLTLGPVTSYTNLSFVPVFGPDAIKDDLLLVDEALRTGYFTVTDSGQISLLLADSRLGMKIFVPSGAIVEGRTQNRVSEFPAVIPPRSKGVQLAVRCAETRTATERWQSLLVVGDDYCRIGEIRLGRPAQDLGHHFRDDYFVPSSQPDKRLRVCGAQH